MKEKKLKGYVLPSIYVLSFVLIMLGAYLSALSLENAHEIYEDNLTYVSSIIVSSDIPVIATDDTIKKPYTDANVSIGKGFYNKSDEENNQIKSIIFYDNTYMPNSGVDYVAKEKFTISSILSGTVIAVKTDDLLGNIVEVKHGNNLISVYQGLTNVSVKTNDILTQGQQIGTSGTNKINQQLGNHLHFELYYQGQVVNPEEYYGKQLKEL